MKRSAEISKCGQYRYSLSRNWVEDGEVPLGVTWIMLNPSTADALVDDPTIRRCIDFTSSWNGNFMNVVNLYGYRATDPKELLLQDDPVGRDNDDAIRRAAFHPSVVLTILAWGENATHQRVSDVLALLAPVHHSLYTLKINKSGQPGHPLYLPKRSDPIQFFPDNVLGRHKAAQYLQKVEPGAIINTEA